MRSEIDRAMVDRAFAEYAAGYDADNIKIRLKIDHTYRVASFTERIAESLSLDRADVDFAWLSGMLHDIGRFEQLKRYGTFIDRLSVDHAELGADILFHDGLIGSFMEKGKDGARETMMERAIRLHNKLTLPEDLDDETRMFSDILRDADKCDIFRVLTEPPFDERNGKIVQTKDPARDSVMQYVRMHRCVPKNTEYTAFEGLIAQCCMAFELVYPESRRILKEQGYLDTLMNLELQGEPAKQMAALKDELKKAFEAMTNGSAKGRKDGTV
ncbi:MAG: HD domain-containing protein [Lachnospiraceae bacterium]|nr:HD domain-containing protein [Lachnospiraceae bacterium]